MPGIDVTKTILEDPRFALSDDYPAARALADAELNLLCANEEFNALLDLNHEPGPNVIRELFGHERPSLEKYLDTSGRQGIIIRVTTPQNRMKDIKIISRKTVYSDKTYYCIVFFDFTSARESASYFEQSFDQFMNATIDLENALSTIEQQKSEIEKINKEMNEVNIIMKKDLQLAEILQNELKPVAPVSEMWDISFYSKPMAGVSGDFLDFYDFKDGNLNILLLDASGHGVSSALITVIARPLFFHAHRKYRTGKIAQAMESANRGLCRHIGHTSNYLTGISLKLCPDCFHYVNAAHPYIMYYRKSAGRVFELENDGFLLGIPQIESHFKNRKVMVAPEDVLFMYTDGLTEAKNEAGEEFGIEPIKDILLSSNCSAAEIMQQIRERSRAFGISEDKLQDDVTCIVIKKAV